jgi:hypothetical protein
MTNHIKALQIKGEVLKAENDSLREGIVDMFAYLSSLKFANDPTVQTRDVMTRLSEIVSRSFDAGLETIGQEAAKLLA